MNNEIYNNELVSESVVAENTMEFGVVKKQKRTKSSKIKTCTVISYDKKSGILVFECEGQIYQSNNIKYDGVSATFEWKC